MLMKLFKSKFLFKAVTLTCPVGSHMLYSEQQCLECFAKKEQNF